MQIHANFPHAIGMKYFKLKCGQYKYSSNGTELVCVQNYNSIDLYKRFDVSGYVQ